jgi:hypothetical protein
MLTENRQFDLQVLVDGRPLEEYSYQGEIFIEGIIGSNFTLRIGKTLPYRRALAVISVDGLSIMDGKLAKADGGGYVIDSSKDHIEIPGWRLNDKEVASFFFSSLPEAYAAQMGKPTNIGVIGAKFFYEKLPEEYGARLPPPMLPPQPAWEGAPRSPAAVPGAPPAQNRVPLAPGVGTGFGSRQTHNIQTVSFERDHTTMQTLVLRYDTAENLEARGIILHERGDRVMKADPFPGDSNCTPPPGWKE